MVRYLLQIDDRMIPWDRIRSHTDSVRYCTGRLQKVDPINFNNSNLCLINKYIPGTGIIYIHKSIVGVKFFLEGLRAVGVC